MHYETVCNAFVLYVSMGFEYYVYMDKKDYANHANDYLLQFGNTAIQSAYCPNCDGIYFVIDGILQCCGAPYKSFQRKGIKVMSPAYMKRKVDIQIKKKLYKQQEGFCFYCGREIGYYYTKHGKVYQTTVHYDHVVPFASSYNNHFDNLVAACSVCNSLKSDKMFKNMEQLRSYLHETTKAKGIKICSLSDMQYDDVIQDE